MLERWRFFRQLRRRLCRILRKGGAIKRDYPMNGLSHFFAFTTSAFFNENLIMIGVSPEVRKPVGENFWGKAKFSTLNIHREFMPVQFVTYFKTTAVISLWSHTHP